MFSADVIKVHNKDGRLKDVGKKLYDDSDFCDVTLVCEDGDVLAHGFVLSTGSNVFSKMLKSTNTNQPNHNTNKPNHKVQLKGICKKGVKLDSRLYIPWTHFSGPK